VVERIGGRDPKRLGEIWLLCPYPILTRGLTGVLAGEAEIWHGGEPPEGDSLSCVLLCVGEGEDVVGEVKRVGSLAPGVPIVIFGLSRDLPLAQTVLRAGARGFVHAGMEPAQIVRALSVASEGEFVVPRDLLKDLVAEEPPVDLRDLTPRQREILGLVVEGQTNAQIGRTLFLSESTVKQHLRAAYKVLKVRNRTEAARLLRDKL
jgi:DNA-binding NarL/FixJ family response regulator